MQGEYGAFQKILSDTTHIEDIASSGHHPNFDRVLDRIRGPARCRFRARCGCGGRGYGYGRLAVVAVVGKSILCSDVYALVCR